jgi:hypothetical protein
VLFNGWELADADDYDGFLKGVFSEKRWKEVAEWAKQQYQDEAKKVDMATTKELQAAFEVFSKEKVSFADRATFERIVVKALVVAASPEASKPLVAAVGNILAGLAEVTKGGFAKFHVFLQEVCMAGVQLRNCDKQQKLEAQKNVESLNELYAELVRRYTFDIEAVLQVAAAGSTIVLPDSLTSKVFLLRSNHGVCNTMVNLAKNTLEVIGILEKLNGTDTDKAEALMKELTPRCRT